MSYSAEQLKDLAKNNPKELINIIERNISNIPILTEAIENLGEETKDEAIVLPIFKRLLKHIHAQVRESTVLAVMSFYVNKKPPQDILDRLKAMVKSDPSPIVRDCGEDALNNF